MLKKLKIRNFALMENVELEMGPGLNIFTGETGAGKSILIEALNFLLGERAQSEWLRTGASKLEVEGVFIGREPVTIRRELDENSRSRAFIDGSPASVAELSALGQRLMDCHGQHEHQALLRLPVQLKILDSFGKLQPLVHEARQTHQELKACRAQQEAAALSEDEKLRRLDMCRFQLEEIEKLSLRPGEDAELETALPRLKNGAKLRSAVDQVYESMYQREGAVLECLLKSENALQRSAELDPEINAVLSQFGQARILLEETVRALAAYRQKLEVDPEKLDEVMLRLDQIARAKKKYGASIDDILKRAECLKEEMEGLENAELRAADLQARAEKIESRMRNVSDRLHQARMEAAKKLGELIVRELKTLGMPDARFVISVTMEEGEYGPTGADEAQYLFSANRGEPLKPLKSIVSGGELSRTMLAIKTVLIGLDGVEVLIFDEIDSGIGGSVATAVGQKLALLAGAQQVVCVTHLPQIACYGQRHFHVFKTSGKTRTEAFVALLEKQARLEEIARMLAGKKATRLSLKHAQELLEEVSR